MKRSFEQRENEKIEKMTCCGISTLYSISFYKQSFPIFVNFRLLNKDSLRVCSTYSIDYKIDCINNLERDI